MSQQRLLEGLKSGAKVATVPASNAEESNGKRGSFAGARAPELARDITRNSSGFLVLDRFVTRDTFARTIACSRTPVRHTFCQAGRTPISSSRDSHCRL
jgi:hypothetical protein